MLSTMHREIRNHQTQTTINFLKNKNNYFEDFFDEKDGLSLLQVAAREGMLDVVLYLLQAGAAVNRVNSEFQHADPWIRAQASMTPLDHALARGHGLVAQILLASGAKKEEKEQKKKPNLAINPTVICSILMWIIRHDADKAMMQLFKSNLENLNKLPESKNIISGLVELALRYKRKQLARELMLLLPPEGVRLDSNILCAGYWAATQNPELFDLACVTDEHYVLMLRQLHRENKTDIFEKYFKSARREVIDKFTEEDWAPSDNELVLPRHRRAYQLASRGDYKNADRFIKSSQDYHCVLQQAYTKKNLVALDHLSHARDAKSMCSFLIKEDAQDLTFFWFIYHISTLKLYDIALENRNDLDQLARLFRNYWSIKGVLQNIISRGVYADDIPSQEALRLFNNVEKESSDILTILQSCIRERYQLPLSRLVLQPHEQTFMVKIEGSLNEEDERFVAALCKRFNIHTQPKVVITKVSKFEDMPDDIQKIMFSYLDERDHKQLWGYSQNVRDLISKLKSNEEWVLSHRLYNLQKELRFLNAFLDQLKQEIETKSCWSGLFGPSGRRKQNLTKLYLVLLLGMFLTGFAAFLGDSASNYNKRFDELQHTSVWPGSRFTCAEKYYDKIAFPCGPKSARGRISEACLPVCDSLGGYFDRMCGASMGVTFFGALFLMLFCIFVRDLKQTVTQGDSRFNHDPINNCSDKMKRIAVDMFEAFKEASSNPFEQMSLASEIGAVRAIATEMRDMKQAEFNSIVPPEFLNEHSIKIFDDEEKNAESDDESVELEPFLNKRNSSFSLGFWKDRSVEGLDTTPLLGDEKKSAP